MTFEEWQKTGRTKDSDFTDLLDNTFGYVPDNVIAVQVYAPGVIAWLKDGQFYTHVERSEYTGGLYDVERRLWDDYAKHEVGGCES
jgi:hypothetical protein